MPEADEDDGPDAGWTVRLREVERLEPDEGDKGEAYFSVEFELSGLGVSGSLTAMVVDPGDETTIIREALDQLQDGLETFARVVGRREGAEPTGGDFGSDTDSREAAGGPPLGARVEAVELLLREVLGFSPTRAGIVDRARQVADALVSEATLSGNQGQRERAAEVRTAVERLTE